MDMNPAPEAVCRRHFENQIMKLKSVLGWSSALCLGACALQAQETKSLDDVQKQIQQMQESFNKVVQEQQQKIEALTRQVEALKKEKEKG